MNWEGQLFWALGASGDGEGLEGYNCGLRRTWDGAVVRADAGSVGGDDAGRGVPRLGGSGAESERQSERRRCAGARGGALLAQPGAVCDRGAYVYGEAERGLL